MQLLNRWLSISWVYRQCRKDFWGPHTNSLTPSLFSPEEMLPNISHPVTKLHCSVFHCLRFTAFLYLLNQFLCFSVIIFPIWIIVTRFLPTTYFSLHLQLLQVTTILLCPHVTSINSFWHFGLSVVFSNYQVHLFSGQPMWFYLLG